MKFLTILFTVMLLQSIGLAGGLQFQCGNHHPAHIAGTLEEAQRFSQLKGCTNWDVRGLFNNDAAKRRLLEILNGKGKDSNPSG